MEETIQDQDANIRQAAFPASEAFEVINAALQSSDAERKDAMKSGNAVFAFVLKNKAGEEDSWNIDLKNKGEVTKGLGDKPTGAFYSYLPHTHGFEMRALELLLEESLDGWI